MSEELKIIMDTIAQLGTAGKEAFIWWLLIKYALHYAVVLVFILCATLAIFKIAKEVRASQAESGIAERVAKAAGLSYSRNAAGVSQCYKWIEDNDKRDQLGRR